MSRSGDGRRCMGKTYKNVCLWRTNLYVFVSSHILYDIKAFICSMNDPRYPTIRPLYEKGLISSFLDIFNYVPKTVVAKDLGKNESRFIDTLDHLENFNIAQLYLIGNLCGLTRLEILELFMMEVAKQEVRDNKEK